MIPIQVTVFRWNPATEETGRMVGYEVSVHEGARVLEVLQKIHDEIDPSLSFRSSCKAGQCGSCAVLVNSEPKLACMTEAFDGMEIKPLNLPVIQDLTVDLIPGINQIPRITTDNEAGLPTHEEIQAIKPLRDCIECFSCISVCPACDVTAFTGPAAMRGFMRIALDPRDSANRIGKAIEDGLFTCTSCGKCLEVCPKNIEIPGKAIEKLREIANKAGLTLPRHQEVEKLVQTTGRSVPREKLTFLEQVGEVIEPEGEVRGEVGFFVGCMFNGRLPDTALDMLYVMRKNGIRVIIPPEQVCCGSPLIRTGQTSYLKKLQETNKNCFSKRGITTVMTMCAGCGATLKNDYPDKPFVVKDVTEVLVEYGIIPTKKLPVTATYHDPCHLLRGQGIFDEPRSLLIPAVQDFIEMPSICCGSGGGVRSGMPDEAAALGENRREAIKKTGADIVVTVCPFCEYHIQEHTDRPVKNLLTVLREGYEAMEVSDKESTDD